MSARYAVAHHSRRRVTTPDRSSRQAEVVVNRSMGTRQRGDERNARQEDAQSTRQSPVEPKHCSRACDSLRLPAKGPAVFAEFLGIIALLLD